LIEGEKVPRYSRVENRRERIGKGENKRKSRSESDLGRMELFGGKIYVWGGCWWGFVAWQKTRKRGRRKTFENGERRR